MIELYCEDCRETMKYLEKNSVDVILTSPFYNTNKKAGNKNTLLNTNSPNGKQYIRYDKHVDNMSTEEYCAFTKNLFEQFDYILKPNGSILYNISYGNENADCMFRAINEILIGTSFNIADVIVWKKKSAFPNSTSSNKLTRIWEFIFVFARSNEYKTFYTNKRITSYRKTGQAAYENIFNFIEAKNNDGSCPYNKATFSTELCEKLLSIYCPSKGCVYDPFMGSGTTAVACERLGMDCVGSEISENQIKFSRDRLIENFPYLENNEDALFIR